MEDEEKTALFMRNAIKYIGQATDSQKRALQTALLKYPPQLTAVEQALTIWEGLTEKEFMQVCSLLQKKADKDYWEFATRWR